MKRETQFTQLIKIEKNKLQNIEKEIERERAKIANYQKEIEKIEEDILNIDYPTHGTFSMLQQFNIAMHNMKNEIHKREGLIDASNRRIEQLRNDMVLVQREIEKFQYLENEILKKRAEEEKRREAKEMDEIAVLLHFQNRHSF